MNRKYVTRQIVVIVIGFLAMLLVSALMQSYVKSALASRWAKSLNAILADIDNNYEGDDAYYIDSLKQHISEISIGTEEIDFIAYYKYSQTVSDNFRYRVIYSDFSECTVDSKASVFFQRINDNKCFALSGSTQYGQYMPLVISGKQYCAVFASTNKIKVAVVGFIPMEEFNDIIVVYKICISILCVVFLFIIGTLLFLSHKEIKIQINEIDDLVKVMEAKDNRADVLSYLMNEFTFEYDIKSDVVTFGEKYQTIFHRGRTFIKFFETLKTHYTVFHKDVDKIFESYNSVLEGNEEGSFLFRLQMINGQYEWFNAVYKSIKDEKGEVVYVVGKIVNVHESQKEKEVLLNQSTRDPLTGLLNRGELEKRTQLYISSMEKDDKAAMLIMDLDHFKSVNDTFGHSKGDDLLRDVAALLKSEFRTTDIVGRLGGDEFYVFMKDISCMEDAVMKCNSVLHKLEKDVVYEGISVTISSSMGIVEVNLGDIFLDLYMKADSALYNAKENGRDQICIYSDDILKDGKEEKK